MYTSFSTYDKNKKKTKKKQTKNDAITKKKEFFIIHHSNNRMFFNYIVNFVIWLTDFGLRAGHVWAPALRPDPPEKRSGTILVRLVGRMTNTDFRLRTLTTVT